MADKQSQQTEDSSSDDAHDRPKGISALEWLVAFVGLVIVVGTFIFLAAEAVNDNGQPPSLRIDMVNVAAVNEGYVVEIEVLNEGDQTAAEVTIAAQLMDGDSVVEERELTLDYVPPHSARHGGLFFSTDPESGTLVFEPDGYRDP